MSGIVARDMAFYIICYKYLTKTSEGRLTDDDSEQVVDHISARVAVPATTATD